MKRRAVLIIPAPDGMVYFLHDLITGALVLPTETCLNQDTMPIEAAYRYLATNGWRYRNGGRAGTATPQHDFEVCFVVNGAYGGNAPVGFRSSYLGLREITAEIKAGRITHPARVDWAIHCYTHHLG